MKNPLEPDEKALDCVDYKFSAKWAFVVAVIPVTSIGISVFRNPLVNNDPGMFVVASPFLFFGVFVPLFVFLVLGRRIWRERKDS